MLQKIMPVDDENLDEDRSETAKHLRLLVLGALGVVFGDIGTSPLYAMRVCFDSTIGIRPTPENILGVLSMVFWALVIVISVKYLVFVLRADLKGEGGILALMTLVAGRKRPRTRYLQVLVALGLFGAALLYGDGMITPAMSVLSAVEGVSLAAPSLKHLVLPLTIAILAVLFVVQKRGTRAVGAVFGPVMLVWFAVIGLLGLWWIAKAPGVLAAVNPFWAIDLMTHGQRDGYLILGGVFLAVTGGEALYADLGHFGKRPIRWGWFAVALPALLVNYFGQGALLMSDPTAAGHSFYHMAPGWSLYPLIGLATVATVIASQAVISGAFSLTNQALQLGYSPNVDVEHYSADGAGAVYVPVVNYLLLAATIGLVLGFKSSVNLAGAYGVAVSTTMLVTTMLVFVFFRRRHGWSLLPAAALCGGLLAIDLAFWGANLAKIGQGGWFPLLVGVGVYTAMSTWRRGRELLDARMGQARGRIEDFINEMNQSAVHRTKGTAVYLTSDVDTTPTSMLKNLAHNKVLHEQIILLCIQTEEVPRVPARERLELRSTDPNFVRLVAHYGFMQFPNVKSVLRLAEELGVHCQWDDMTYFFRQESFIVTDRSGMARWRKHFFALMARNAQDASLRLHVPPNDVIGVDMQIEL